MQTTGYIEAPTPEAVAEEFQSVASSAGTLTSTIAKSMDVDSADYDELVTDDVVQRAHVTLFAALLRIQQADREAFEEWCESHPAYEPEIHGSEAVEGVAWHAAPVADVVVATTFATEPDAAVETLRRIAWSEVYEPVLSSLDTLE